MKQFQLSLKVANTTSNNNIKSIIFALILLLTTNQNINAQEGWINQLSETETLNCIQFTDASMGWAVGDAGTILKTTDGGITWNLSNGEIAGDCGSVCFVNSEMGWVTEYGWINNTIDGGTTWSYQFNEPYSPLLYSIYFTDSNNGWVVGQYGFIMNTTNGGNTWTEQVSGSNAWFNTVFFVDSTTGWVVGNDYNIDEAVILHTTNGGNNWTPQINGCTLSLNSVYFINTEIGWAFGGPDTLLKTTNGGNNWDKKELGFGFTYFNSAYFIDENNGWAVGDLGDIISTIDGGENWRYQESGTSVQLNSVYFLDESTGWVVGGSPWESNTGIILKTTNGGITLIEEKEFEPIPKNYYLDQNYPNPFNPTTSIAYVLQSKSHVIITIYNVLGHKVDVLVNEIQNAGNHKTVWDANSSASGVYLYTIKAISMNERTAFRSAKKMILLK